MKDLVDQFKENERRKLGVYGSHERFDSTDGTPLRRPKKVHPRNGVTRDSSESSWPKREEISNVKRWK